MKSVHLLFPISLLFAGCAFGVQGSGVRKVDPRPVGAFSELDLSGSFEVEVEAGAAPSLAIEADDNLLPLLKSELSGERLTISSEEHLNPSRRIRIRATTPSLRLLAISGSAKILLEKLAGPSFELSSSGSSEVAARGTVGELVLDISGSADVVATELVAERVKIDAGGSCDVAVHATESLSVDASGSCDVRYLGRPALELDVSGSGSVEPYRAE